MDFDKPKVYGDTSITDGLVFSKNLDWLPQAFRETPAVSSKIQLAWKYAGRPFAYHGFVT